MQFEGICLNVEKLKFINFFSFFYALTTLPNIFEAWPVQNPKQIKDSNEKLVEV